MPETELMLAEEQIIAGALEQMRHMQRQIWVLHRYAEHEVACPTGFRGVFEVLRPALGELASASEAMARGFASRYADLIDALDASAHSLRTCDELVDTEFGRIASRASAA